MACMVYMFYHSWKNTIYSNMNCGKVFSLQTYFPSRVIAYIKISNLKLITSGFNKVMFEIRSEDSIKL